MFYVYVLRSESDFGFYIGFSTDLKKRLSQHRRGASFATKSRGPWKLIYYEAYTEREDAEGPKDISRVDQADDFSEHSSNSISCKNPLLDRVEETSGQSSTTS